jgi:DNA invertase Pin-like site-specific DNA recombinase
MAEGRNEKAAGDMLAAYLRHASKFGVECVFETAEAELGDRSPALSRLRIELDAIEAGRRIGLRGLGRCGKRRRSRAETLEAVRQLRAEGLVIGAIADKLGVTDETVGRYLNSKNGLAKPHGYAAKSAPKRVPA